MKRKRPARRPSAGSNVSTAARPATGQPRPAAGQQLPAAAQQRPPNKDAGRNLARAGGRGSGDAGTGSIVPWSAAFVVIAVAVIAAAVISSQLSGGGSSSGSPVPPSVITPTSIPSDGRTLGDPGAPVTIDIYGDFRCSACFVFTTGGTEKNLVDNYVATGKARLVWHDFLTIDQGGVTASRDAANAAWCAADQGKFWVMHDWLYANQSPTEDASAFTQSRLTEIGQEAAWTWRRTSRAWTRAPDAAIAAEQTATPAQVVATPSIIVNGKFVAGADAASWPTYDLIKAAIDAALASTARPPPRARPRAQRRPGNPGPDAPAGSRAPRASALPLARRRRGPGRGVNVAPGLPLAAAAAVGVGVGVASSPPGRRIPAALAIKAAAVTQSASSAIAATRLPLRSSTPSMFLYTPAQPRVPRCPPGRPRTRIPTSQQPARPISSRAASTGATTSRGCLRSRAARGVAALRPGSPGRSRARIQVGRASCHSARSG